jgi:hypothetical protein
VGETYEVEFDLVLPDNDVVIETAEEPIITTRRSGYSS